MIEPIERGDMRAGSWRMVVGKDRWGGDTRHIEAIAELKDVTIVGAEEPANGEAPASSTGQNRRPMSGRRNRSGREHDHGGPRRGAGG